MLLRQLLLNAGKAMERFCKQVTKNVSGDKQEGSISDWTNYSAYGSEGLLALHCWQPSYVAISANRPYLNAYKMADSRKGL